MDQTHTALILDIPNKGGKKLVRWQRDKFTLAYHPKYSLSAVYHAFLKVRYHLLGVQAITLRWKRTQDQFWIPVKILAEYVSLMPGLPRK